MNDLQAIYQKYSRPNLGGGDKGTGHSYIETYHNLFESIRNQPLNILEIGILEGHSIKMWKEYFTNSKIYACDINDKKYLNLNDDRTTIILGDATESKTFHNITSLDIVIDDGSHKLNNQIDSFDILKEKVNFNGVYIIEDVFFNHVEHIQKRFDNCFEVVDMRHLRNNLQDNILMIYKKLK